MMISKYGKFLTLKEFQNNFEIKVNYIAILLLFLLLFILLLLIAAISPGLKQKAFDSPVPNLLALCNNRVMSYGS